MSLSPKHISGEHGRNQLLEHLVRHESTGPGYRAVNLVERARGAGSAEVMPRVVYFYRQFPGLAEDERRFIECLTLSPEVDRLLDQEVVAKDRGDYALSVLDDDGGTEESIYLFYDERHDPPIDMGPSESPYLYSIDFRNGRHYEMKIYTKSRDEWPDALLHTIGKDASSALKDYLFDPLMVQRLDRTGAHIGTKFEFQVNDPLAFFRVIHDLFGMRFHRSIWHEVTRVSFDFAERSLILSSYHKL